MRVWMSLAAFSIVLLLPSGCSTPAERLDSAAAGKVHEGQSQQEVRQMLGPPQRSESAEGRSLDVFVFLSNKRTAQPSLWKRDWVIEARSLFVLYDTHQKVENVVGHLGYLAANSGFQLDWQAGYPFTPEDVNGIQREVTTGDDLIRRFGQPTVEGLDVRGQRMLWWLFLRGHKTRANSTQELIVTVDGKSVVKDFVLRNIQPGA
jgi:outer membrane protein assembly factor BamE (lipoprotein component of BamABCDE complex)